MIEVRDSGLNELELIVVHEHLRKRGTEWAKIYRGNGCIWVASGTSSCPINEYFIFRDGTLVDIQVD